MADKKTIRNHYRSLRLNLSPGDYELYCAQLCARFFSSIDLASIKTIHCYLPILRNKEPNTWLIVERLKKDFPDIRISIPKMASENKLINYYFEGSNQIKNNNLGIPEPQFGEETPLEKIDLVIVPLLAFDHSGHRIGYGKGFYDRFLRSCRKDCKKIGVSFFDPVEAISDISKNDVKLDAVITPTRFLTLN